VGLIAPVFQGTLAVVRSTFKSLQDLPDSEIIIRANYPYEYVEYSEATWEHVWDLVTRVFVFKKAGASSVVLGEDSAAIDKLLSSDIEAHEG
jgi:hypothetical protein